MRLVSLQDRGALVRGVYAVQGLQVLFGHGRVLLADRHLPI